MTEIVAEISGNHGGKIEHALALIKAAKGAGADAVKFQCFEPERLAAKRAQNMEVVALAKGQDLLELYRQTHTPKPWFPELIAYCNEIGIAWFSSVFDPFDVAFLETLDCPRYKISAFEMLDWELIRAVRETGKPIVMSVRPANNVTILNATDYDGNFVPFGLSAHGLVIPTNPACPMVEWHLKLPWMETLDSDFSLEPSQFAVAAGLSRAA